MTEKEEKKESVVKTPTESTLLKKGLFLEQFIKNACNISQTCKAIDIDRGTYYLWTEKDPEFVLKVEEARDALRELAESQLFKNIISGKEPSLFFFLVNRYPDRWRNIQKVEHSGEVKTYDIKELLVTVRKIPEGAFLEYFTKQSGDRKPIEQSSSAESKDTPIR